MKYIFTIFIAAIVLTSCGVGSVLRYPPHRWMIDEDRKPFDFKKTKGSTHGLDKSVFEKMGLAATFSKTVSDVSSLVMLGGRQEAIDINNFDEVADSTWFTNRIGRREISRESAVVGAGSLETASGPFQVLFMRTTENVPRLLVRDDAGAMFVMRFDPKGLPRISTGAEMITAGFLHAAGYNVPASSLIMLDSQRLRVTESSRKIEKYGKTSELKIEDLLAALDNASTGSSGKYHAIVVPVPGGYPLGPFKWSGKRRGDPNDRIPHEHRRVLRALYVFADFLDLSITNPFNTMDVFVPEGYVLHTLFDLSGSLGSLRAAELLHNGVENPDFDVSNAASALFTFGFYNPYKDSGSKIHRELGISSTESYEPGGWGIEVKNSAFAYMTRRDAFWAAKILSRFSDEHIKAIAKRAGYEDKRLEREMAKVLVERRDRAVAYWFSQLNPLDDFDLSCGEAVCSLSFKNLSTSLSDQDAEDFTYRMKVISFKGNYELSGWAEFSGHQVIISRAIIEGMIGNRVYRVRIQSRHGRENLWRPSVDVFMRQRDGRPYILGIDRKYKTGM